MFVSPDRRLPRQPGMGRLRMLLVSVEPIKVMHRRSCGQHKVPNLADEIPKYGKKLGSRRPGTTSTSPSASAEPFGAISLLIAVIAPRAKSFGYQLISCPT